jgi:putative intracellular protease/amidase
VIAILALNEGTETTDFLLPHAVLKRADVADVQPVAPRGSRVVLYPALQVDGAQDLADFDRAHPSGADYVIVPAMKKDDDPQVIGWLQRQADQGARVIGICVGALVLGRAGLLDGRRFSGHWFYRKTLLARHPKATYIPHQRYLIDRDIGTTTGITASVPAMLALVEAIGGHDKARALATELGVDSWSPVHDSTPFFLNASRRWDYILNKVAFWRDERRSLEVQDGSDDVTLAFTADAWSRTGHVSVEATSSSGPVKLRSGLVLLAQAADDETLHLPLTPGLKPVQQLDRTLCEIAGRYGVSRREWVMLEMEYARMSIDCSQPEAS